MIFSVYLVIIMFIVAVCYGIIPIIGGFYIRNKWRKFRNRFNDMRLSPLLDYRLYRHLEKEGGLFRFSGSFESITDGHTLWVRGKDLSIPVSLEKTKCYIFPIHEGVGIPQAPELIRWNRVSTITEGSKVFIGGLLKSQDNRLNFVSTKEHPLVVIFYSCTDDEFTSAIIRAARTRNEYWNNITPISLIIGAIILIFIATFFLNRPAFRLTVITALAAIFIPILPIFPPGFLFTILYRRLTWSARKLRVYWDLARFGLLPGSNNKIIRRYAIRAYSLEIIAWIIVLLGIAINIVFIFLILSLFQIISF